MNLPDVVNGDDEHFTLLLARYSEALDAGGDADPAADPALPAELRQRLQRALSCLRLLRQFRPQLPQPDAVTRVIEKDITLHDDFVGGQLGRFHILRPLGHGGGGIVFLAFDPDLRREVALKIPLLPSLLAPDQGWRFLREAEAAAQLDHPNLVPVYEAAKAKGVCFLVAAYCRGGSLAKWLATQTRPVPVRQAAEWLAALADAVHYVHAHGIFHRDIKPSNILLELRSGNDLIPRLSDFGLAKIQGAQTESTRSGTVLGTPSYMAPEQVEGRLRDIGPATDVYGLGAVLYEMLTGRPPFRGVSDTDTLRQVLAEEPVPPRRLRRDVPSDVQTICLKCLDKEPARRYARAAELAEDLRRYLDQEPIAARPLRRSERLRKWVRRRPAKAVLFTSGLLFVLVLGLSWFQLESLQQAHDAHRTASAKEIEEHQEAVRRTEQRLRQLHYAEDIAQAWRSWENRRLEEMTSPLDKYRSTADSDKTEDVRSFEWHYLSRLSCTRPLVMRHPALMECAAFSPDGATCASGHHDGAIVLWDTASGRRRRIMQGHKLRLGSLTYSPDGKYLASASGCFENGNHRGELLLWDVRTAKALSVFPTSLGSIQSVAFSPDGRMLTAAIFFGTGASEVKFWEIPSGTLRNTISFPYPGAAASVAFSSDGTKVAIGHTDGRISLCDPETGEILESHSGHQNGVKSAACGHKDPVFVSGGIDGKVRLCSLRSGGTLLAEYCHEDIVWSVAFSPDDRLVASLSQGILKVWDCDTRYEHFSRALPGAGRSVEFSPDGKTLAVGLEDGRLWMYDVFRAPDGRVAINDDSSPAETLSWLAHREGKEPREAWAAAFSPDGKILASAGDDHIIRLWDPATGRELAILRGHETLVTSVAFSPDGKRLASGSFDEAGPVKLWEVASGKDLATLNGHNHRVNSVVFSPDGKILASAGRDCSVRLWDMATLKDRPILAGRKIESLAFSPDGCTLALDSSGQAPFLWDIEEQKVRRTLLSHSPGHVAVAFSPDGKTVVTGGFRGTVRFFDAATSELRFSARSHSDAVNCLAFSPDGKTLASAGFDKRVKLWQVSTGRELLTLPEQKDRVRWLAFSPDGATLATAGHDGILKIYRADKPEPRP